MRARVGCLLLLWMTGVRADVLHAQSTNGSQQDGGALYRSACAACHGADGRGAPRAAVGFDLALPDFTDCSFATPEADADWMAVVHDGGRARAFDRMMPAFGEALSDSEIALVVGHLRSFCAEPGWPRGDLNLPRPLVTEKAFPENEAVLTTGISRSGGTAVGSEFLYERRVGNRGQYEIAVPFDVQRDDETGWARGLGDVAVAYKHVVAHSLPRGAIVSAGAEVIFPTGKEAEGLGEGTTTFEPFGTYSQILPANGFLHLHAGVELPAAGAVPKVPFWRAAVGRTFVEREWYRAWSPMFEILGSRRAGDGEAVEWDVVPQLQVSLSTRQHVLLNAGVRVPVNRRRGRDTTVMLYLLWDWFDGGFFSGWR